MARIYSDNESHSCNYGVDFINGAAVVPDAETEVIAWFTLKGYTVVPGVDALSHWDCLTKETLVNFAPAVGVDPEGMTKAELVAAIEAQLALMKIDITAFDAIANVDGGTVAEPEYANAAAVIAALPDEANANNDAVAIPVTNWVDTDTYNPAVAGSYTFTATLGDLPVPYANPDNLTATIEIVVAAE